MHRVSCRLAALFLATTFLGGGVGLPGLDALLYHSGRQPYSNVTRADHVDRPGGCDAHAEHCVLAASTSVRQVVTLAVGGMRISTAVCRDCVAAPVAPRSAERLTLPASRAPPIAAS
jgi:hypothetical protein